MLPVKGVRAIQESQKPSRRGQLPYILYGVFTDRFIFSWNFPRIQTSKGALVTNCSFYNRLSALCHKSGILGKERTMDSRRYLVRTETSIFAGNSNLEVGSE